MVYLHLQKKKHFTKGPEEPNRPFFVAEDSSTLNKDAACTPKTPIRQHTIRSHKTVQDHTKQYKITQNSIFDYAT